MHEKGGRYDTQDVEIKTVKFLADRQWVKLLRRNLKLEKGNGVKTIQKIKNTEDERHQIAIQFLEENPYLTVQDYAQMTKLGRTRASEELRTFANDPERGIQRRGRGSHVVYVKKPTQKV